MVDRLQRKFMLITTTTLFLVLFIFVITLNLINIININRQSDSLLNLIQEYDGNLPREFKDVKPKNIYDFYGFINKNDYNKRVPIHNIYFSVKIFYDGSILVNIRNNDSIDILDAKSLAENVINSNRYKGYKGFYKFLVSDMYGYKLVSFVDSSNDISKSVDFAIISMFVVILFVCIFGIILNFVSKYAIKPFIDNIEKQKVFITNAGHEIKTPLAIILANTEVIEIFNGENEWTKSTINQVKRLDGLVKRLLSLSKMDENNFRIDRKEVYFGKIVSEIVNDFEVYANTKNLKIIRNIDEDLMFNCSEEYIRDLVSILIDNAIKYCDDCGKIEVFLNYKGGKIEFCVSNTFNNGINGNMDYLFDRFYRMDNSRSRDTGGYGLGLSIADSIVRHHKGKIDAFYKDGKISFNIVFNKIN